MEDAVNNGHVAFRVEYGRLLELDGSWGEDHRIGQSVEGLQIVYAEAEISCEGFPFQSDFVEFTVGFDVSAHCSRIVAHDVADVEA